MNSAIFAAHQVRLFLKSPNVVALLVLAPLFMIFIFAQAFSGIFAAASPTLSSMDYFGSTMFTMAVFQGAFVSYWGVSKERKANAETRIRLCPARGTSFILGTFAGSWLILVVLGTAVLLSAGALLGTDYGPSPLPALALAASLAALASSLGLAAAALVPNERLSGALLNTLVPLLVFAGGGYMKIPDSGFLADVSRLSPVRWVNLAIFDARVGLFADNAGMALAACLIPAAVLLALAIAISGRKR